MKWIFFTLITSAFLLQSRLNAHSRSHEFGHRAIYRGGAMMNYRTAPYNTNRYPNAATNNGANSYYDPMTNGYSNYYNGRNYGTGYRYDYGLQQQPNNDGGFSNGGLFDFTP